MKSIRCYHEFEKMCGDKEHPRCQTSTNGSKDIWDRVLDIIE